MRNVSDRLCWVLGGMAALCFGFAVLAVSEQRARADAGDDCVAACIDYWGDVIAYADCMTACCKDKCASDPDPMTCQVQCQGKVPGCVSGKYENRFCNYGGYCVWNLVNCGVYKCVDSTDCKLCVCQTDWVNEDDVCWCYAKK